MKLTRRQMLQTGAAAAAAGVTAPLLANPTAHAAAEAGVGEAGVAQTAPAASQAVALKPTGKLAPRPSKAIKASPISVGFETLDRSQFDPEKCYDHAGQSGVKWARLQTGWARCEKSPGVYDFSWLDRQVDQLLARGIQPWFNLGYGNKLYIKEAFTEFAVGWIPLYNDEARAAWVKFVDKLAEHFKDRVTHWELWNEPNIPNFWQPTKPNGADYVKFVEITAPLIRKRVKNSYLIGCGLAGIPLQYLEDCLDAGLAKHVDAISYHPYRPTPEINYASSIAALRALVNRYKPGMALWQGENGAPSAPNGTGALSQLDWTEPAQAKWLTRRLVLDLAAGIEVTSYFLIVDIVNYVALKATGKTNFKGVLRGTDYTPKPSFNALQHVCRLFDADTKRADLMVEFGDATRAATLTSATFVRQGKPLVAYWQPAALPAGQSDLAPVDLKVWGGKKFTLERPVVVDLVTGDIYDVPAPKPDVTLAFTGLPLMDAPMILTDRSVVEG